jgi:hypothetical protein
MQYTNGSGAATRIPVITGASLVHRRLSPQQRAVVAAGILDGHYHYQPTQAGLAASIGVSVQYIIAARKLPPGKRALILQGYDVGLPALVNHPRRRVFDQPCTLCRIRPPARGCDRGGAFLLT